MGNELSRHMEPEEYVSDQPAVVEEAHEVLAAYGRHLLLTGGGAVALFAWSNFVGVSIPWLALALTLALLGILYMAPVTREPKLAREVLWRWDRLRVDRALHASGVGDPRLEVAESMAERVLRHPSASERVRQSARHLVRRLRVLLRDLDRVNWLNESRASFPGGSDTRSISDLQDMLDARVADIIHRIAELHSTVIMRDMASLERVTAEAEELLLDLEAEREVERLISAAERT